MLPSSLQAVATLEVPVSGWPVLLTHPVLELKAGGSGSGGGSNEAATSSGSASTSNKPTLEGDQ